MTPVVTAQTRAAAQHGMLGERSLSRWPALAAADVPVLLLLATEPEQVRAANDEGARDVAARHPGADIRALPGWGHDLIGDGGPALAEIIADWLTTSARQPAASVSSRTASRAALSDSGWPGGVLQVEHVDGLGAEGHDPRAADVHAHQGQRPAEPVEQPGPVAGPHLERPSRWPTPTRPGRPAAPPAGWPAAAGWRPAR